jgi:hypothetical protein
MSGSRSASRRTAQSYACASSLVRAAQRSGPLCCRCTRTLSASVGAARGVTPSAAHEPDELTATADGPSCAKTNVPSPALITVELALHCIRTTTTGGGRQPAGPLAAMGRVPVRTAVRAGLNEYLYGIAEDLEQLNALDVGQSALCTP